MTGQSSISIFPASIIFFNANVQRNRAAAVDVDFKFDAIRRSGSRDC